MIQSDRTGYAQALRVVRGSSLVTFESEFRRMNQNHVEAR